MTDIASIGVGIQTDSIERGIKALDVLAQQGPKVEKALDGVEKTAAKAGKSLKSIGEGAGKGLDDVGRAAPKAAEGVGRVAKNADDAKKALAGMGASTAGLGAVAASAGQAGRGLASMTAATSQAGAGLAGFGSGLKSVQQMMREMQAQAAASAQATAQMASATTAAAASMSAMAKAQGDATRTAQEMARVFQSVGVHAKDGAVGVRNMAEASSGLNSNMRLAAQGVQALLGLQIVGWAKDSAVAMFQASAAAERLRIGLDFASVRGSADEIAYLRKTTDGLGLSFASTAQSYMQFQAAAKGTSIEGDKARAVFESVAKASAVMGLSAEQNSGVLLALQQMVSKGTVQAEELRGQLGERLPGAFQIAARAMGVTTAELGKMLEMGQVVSEDFLPKFAKELEKSLGGAAENAANRLDASVNRFDNAWERMKQKAGDSGVSKAIAGELDAVARDMQAITEAVEGASNKGAGALSALGQGAVVAAGRTGFATLNLMANTLNGTINLLTGDLLGLRTNLAVLPDVFKTNAEQVKILGVDMEGAQSKLKRLQELDAMPSNGNYYKTAIADTNAYIAKLREAIELRSGLAGAGVPAAPGGDPYNDGTSYGVYKGALAAADAALKATSSFKSQAEQLAEVRKQGDAARKALKGLEEQGEGTGEKANELRERLKGVDERLASIAKRGQSGAASAAKSANQELEKQASLLAELSGLSSSFYKDWDSLNKQYAQGRISIKGLEEAQAALLAKQPAMVALAKEEEEVSKARVKAWEEEVKGWQKQVEERNKAAESAEDALLKAREEERAHALAAAASITLAEAVARLTLARAEDNYQKALSKGSDGETLLALQRETDARRGLVEVMQQKGVREANEKAAEAISKEWEKTSQLIGDTLADYIMGGGKDAAQYLKRLFATLVLQPVVKYGVDAAMGALGLGGSQGSGGVGGVANLLSTGKSVYNAFTGQNPLLNQIGSFFGIGSSAALNSASNAALSASAESLSAAATNLATGSALDIASAEAIAASAESLTTGAASNAASSSGGMATMWPLAILAGMMVSNKLYGAGYSQKDRNGFGGAISIGNTVETNILGKIVGDKVANILTGAPLMTYVNELLGLSATAHKGAGAIYAGGDIQEGAAIYNQGSFGMGHADEYAASSQAAVSSIAANAGMTLDAIAKAFDLKGGYSVSTAFADDRSKDGAWGSLKIADELGKVLVNWEDSRESRWAPKEFANGEEGYKEYLAAVQSDVLTAIQGMDLPAWAKQIFAVSGAAETAEERAKGLEDAIVKVSQLSAIWTSLGRTMEMFAGITGDMQTGLLTASGTMEALTTNVEAYYQGFYSEAERAQKQRELQMGALGDMGLYIDPYQGDAAKEMFRKTVEERMALGQAEVVAQLLAMSGAFAQTADYAQGLTDSLAGVAESIVDLRDSLLSLEGQFAGGGFSRQYQAADAAGQMQKLLAGAGVQMEAEALASIMMSATSAEVEHYFREIWKVLPTEAAQAELVGLANTMMDLAAATDVARASAAQAAAQSMSGAWSNFGTMAGLAAQYTGNTSGLSSQLGIVQGSYANATTTDGRVAALQQIINLEQGLWNGQQAARQAEASAASARASAAREQVNAAKQLLSAAQGLGNYAKSLGFSEASGLGEVERMAALQDQRRELLAKANAGDTNAMQELQGVTGSYLTLAQQMAVSQQDYSVLSGRIAAELAATAAIQEASASSQVSQYERQIAAAESVAASSAGQFTVSAETQKLIDELLVESAAAFETEASLTQKLIDQGALTATVLQGLPGELAGAIGNSLIPAIAGLAAAVSSAMSSAAALNVPQFAAGGFHMGGLRIVGERGPELEATGPSRVWNQSQLAGALGGGNNAALVAAVDRLTAQNARMSAELAEIKASTAKFADQFDQVTAGGNAMATEAFA